MSATFRSLRVRNFRLFFVGQAISQVGTWLTMIAQTLLVLHLTDSGVAVGLLTACQFGPILLLGPWTGLLADRLDKRRLLLVVQTASMAQSFVLAGLAFLHHPPVLAFYVVAFAGGLSVAFDNPARRSYVVELVPEDDVPNAVALNTALMTGARIVGPAIAGLLITAGGFGWCFLLDGLSYVAVLIGLWRIDVTAVRAAPVTERGKAQVRAGLRYVSEVPVLWIALAMTLVIGTLTFNFGVVFPLFVKRTLHGGTGMFTLLFSATGVGSFLSALASARRTTIELRHVVWGAALFGTTMSGLAVAPNAAVAFPVAALVGVSSVAFITSCTTIVQLRADPAMRGRVLALQAMVFLGATPIGGPVLGAICDAWGPRTGLLVGAGAAFLAALGGGLLARRHRVDHEIPALGPEGLLVA